ncbi:MAG: glycosyltransferase [Candidatus Anstonellales archaeon]
MKQKKCRVLHIIPNFRPGGAERLVIELMKASDQEIFEIAAVSLYPESGTILEKEINKNDLKVFYCDKKIGLDLRMFYKLYRIFKEFKPDVVHTHLSVLRYSLLPSILCRIPLRVHTVHSIAQKEVDRIGKIIHFYAFRFAGVVPIGISQNIAASIKEIYGKHIYVPVIYNGVPTASYVSQPGKVLQKEKNKIILHVGSFSTAKNHPLLIEAFEIVQKECPETRLWLVGEGPNIPKVKSLVDEKGLSCCVSFLGIRDDVPTLIASSDIFVMSSDWEGLPLAVIEAMAAGKPVVTTNVGAIPEIVKDGESGIVVPPGNRENLANAILRLLRDHALRERMGNQAKKRAISSFDISRTAREYENLYLYMLGIKGTKDRENQDS